MVRSLNHITACDPSVAKTGSRALVEVTSAALQASRHLPQAGNSMNENSER